MVLETSKMKEESDIILPKSDVNHPDRFPCSVCGNLFTKLGYIYHKKTCSEKDDCECRVCIMSRSMYENARVDPPSAGNNALNISLDDSADNINDKPVNLNYIIGFNNISENINISDNESDTSKDLTDISRNPSCASNFKDDPANINDVSTNFNGDSVNYNDVSTNLSDSTILDVSFNPNDISPNVSDVSENIDASESLIDDCENLDASDNLIDVSANLNDASINIDSISDNVSSDDFNTSDNLNETSVEESVGKPESAFVSSAEASVSDNGMAVDEDSSGAESSGHSGYCNSSSTECLDDEDSLQESKPPRVYAEISDFMIDHGGMPCTRKLFCNHCKQHVLWDSYGVHIIEHSTILETEYIKCPECIKNFSRPTMLLLHYYIHVSTHPLDCVDCRCRYDRCIEASHRSVSEHCYAETYHCYICLKFFTHEQSIANHMRIHTKEMPYKCKECGRSFRQIGNLQRHLTTHRGERPHQCSKCPKSFADPATLRNHMRVHTGETPYVCTMCKRGFTQVGNLKRHMALHLKDDTSSAKNPDEDGIILSTNILVEENEPNESENVDEVMELADPTEASQEATVDPVESNVEENSTSSKKRKAGRKTNGRFKIFTCPECKKIYTWKHDLQVHIRTHTGEKPYCCPLCDKRFAQSGAVRTHFSRHHSKTKSKKKAAKSKKASANSKKAAK